MELTASGSVRALLVALVVVIAGCGDTSERQDARASGEQPEEVEAEVVAGDDAGNPPADAGDRLDLMSLSPADPTAARSIVDAATDPTTVIDPGPWFATSFSETLAFDLPASGRLVTVAQGLVVIEVGEPGDPDHGLLRIIEAVAFASPEGPVPISTIDGDSEFADTTVLARGLADSPAGELSWRDVVIRSELVPEIFRRPCTIGSMALTCIGGPIAESGEVGIEVDQPVRFVAQPLGSRRLYVIATALGPGPSAGAVDAPVFSHALQIAASMTPAARVDEAAVRPLTTLGSRASAIPAGEWIADLGDVEIAFDLENEVVGPRLVAAEPTYVAFELDGQAGSPATFFGVQVFQGFVEGALQDPAANMARPLPAEIYLQGIDNVAGIEASGVDSIGGFATAWFETGGRDLLESPFACSPAQRPADLAPELGCVVYSVDGWMFLDDEETGGLFYRSHYIEELGVVVSFAGTDDNGEFLALEPFQQLLAGLRLSAVAP